MNNVCERIDCPKQKNIELSENTLLACRDAEMLLNNFEKVWRDFFSPVPLFTEVSHQNSDSIHVNEASIL